MLDDSLLDDPARLNDVDSNALLRAAATAGAQVRATAEAAAEVGVGLAMVLLVYRNRRSVALDELSEMKG